MSDSSGKSPASSESSLSESSPSSSSEDRLVKDEAGDPWGVDASDTDIELLEDTSPRAKLGDSSLLSWEATDAVGGKEMF